MWSSTVVPDINGEPKIPYPSPIGTHRQPNNAWTYTLGFLDEYHSNIKLERSAYHFSHPFNFFLRPTYTCEINNQRGLKTIGIWCVYLVHRQTCQRSRSSRQLVVPTLARSDPSSPSAWRSNSPLSAASWIEPEWLANWRRYSSSTSVTGAPCLLLHFQWHSYRLTHAFSWSTCMITKYRTNRVKWHQRTRKRKLKVKIVSSGRSTSFSTFFQFTLFFRGNWFWVVAKAD